MSTASSETLRWIFYAPGIPFHGGSIASGKSLGGSESACFYLAKEASRCGHQVSVFTHIQPEEAGSWEGVRYLSAGQPAAEDLPGIDFINAVRATPHDVLVGQRLMKAFAFPTRARCHLWWAHDMPEPQQRHQMQAQEWNINAILAVSDFQKQALEQSYHCQQQRISVIPNAVDASLFSSPPPPLQARVQKRLFYSSRPERGLEHLVGGIDGKPSIMDHLLKTDPDVRLFVCGYDNSPPWIKELHQFLQHRCEQLPNVCWLGALSKAELARQMMRAWVHVYPTRFPEVSCITAMETQHAGLPMLCTPVGALPETLKDSGTVWIANTENDHDLRMGFVQEIMALFQDNERWLRLHQQALTVRNHSSWKKSFEKTAAIAQKILQQEDHHQPERLAMAMLKHSSHPQNLNRLKHHLAAHPHHPGKLMRLAGKKLLQLEQQPHLSPVTEAASPAAQMPSSIHDSQPNGTVNDTVDAADLHFADLKLAQAAVENSPTTDIPYFAGLLRLAPLKRPPPQQTLSVCILSRMNEAGLARCLASANGIADEWIIGLDAESPHSAAEAREAKMLVRRYGARVISMASPLRTGFAEARNRLQRAASAEWILWLDADEILVWQENLDKYLRDNAFHAYGVPQHHFSLQPLGLLQTDRPCRLLRRSAKFRFYGMVHEHPERGALNSGPGKVFILPDVAISHQGYLTEHQRRSRFFRNLPLMQRDRILHPQRLLGCFLWIRDLTQLNRFEWNQTGKFGTDISCRAQEAVRLWRYLLKTGQSRLATDALPYYSECVRLLKGPNALCLQLQASPVSPNHIPAGESTGSSAAGKERPPNLEGAFMNAADAQQFANLLLKTSLQAYGE